MHPRKRRKLVRIFLEGPLELTVLLGISATAFVAIIGILYVVSKTFTYFGAG